MQAVFTTHRPLILASASPRRQALLAELGLVFSVAAAQIDEGVRAGENPAAFVRRLAFEKAAAIAACHSGSWILAADTVVVIDRVILGKPAGREEAIAMLLRLAGRQHEVWTGFCLLEGTTGEMVQRQVRTLVSFRRCTAEVCRAYVQAGESLDKAGAYGIQGAGGFLVAAIEGSYSNVVGLPLAEVSEELEKIGVISPRDEGTAA